VSQFVTVEEAPWMLPYGPTPLREWPLITDPGDWGWFVALAGSGSASRAVGLGHDPIAPVAGPPVGREVAQVRGVLADRVVISTMLDPFLTLKALVAYSGIGLRKLYEYLADPAHPLPHYRVGGKIVVRRSEFDAWMTAYRRVAGADVGAIVTGVLADFRTRPAR
jgi:predicted DNA-binding transcriptional regulator AlpA